MLSTILEAIIAVGVIAFAIGQFTNGRSQKKDDGLDAAINTIEILKENLSLLTAEQKKDHDEIVGLKKDLEYAKAENTRLKVENDNLNKTILNRNPDLERILADLAETNIEIRDFMKTLNAKQDHQTSMIEGQVKKEAIMAQRDVNLEVGRRN